MGQYTGPQTMTTKTICIIMKAMTVKVGPLPPFLRSEMSKSKLKFALAEEKMRQSNDRKPYHVQ